ncbi:MAG: hypothetical protein ACHBNF_02790 [Chromatiales bacterium]
MRRQHAIWLQEARLLSDQKLVADEIDTGAAPNALPHPPGASGLTDS